MSYCCRATSGLIQHFKCQAVSHHKNFQSDSLLSLLHWKPFQSFSLLRDNQMSNQWFMAEVVWILKSNCSIILFMVFATNRIAKRCGEAIHILTCRKLWLLPQIWKLVVNIKHVIVTPFEKFANNVCLPIWVNKFSGTGIFSPFNDSLCVIW